MKKPRPYIPRWGIPLSALLCALALPPAELNGLVWIAFLPWFYALSKCRSWKEALVQGIWLNFFMALFGSFWMVPTLQEYLGLSLPLSLLGFIIHSLTFQLQMVIFSPLFFWLIRPKSKPMGIFQTLIAAFLYTGLDWLAPKLFQDTMGLALHVYPHLVQVAELGGHFLLTFLVALTNLTLFSLLPLKKASGQSRRLSATLWISRILLLGLVLGGAWGFGRVRLTQINQLLQSPQATIQVGVVQGNISNALRTRWGQGDDLAADQALHTYLSLTDQLLGEQPSPQLILWPETAYPGIFRHPENPEQLKRNLAFDRYISAAQRPFIFGAYDLAPQFFGRTLMNSIFFVQPEKNQSPTQPSPMKVYHKYILFPVGEYLPFLNKQWLEKWFPTMGNFATGSGPQAIPIQFADGNELTLGPAICYEDMFPSHLSSLAKQGAQWIINVSNDAWFGNYGEPKHHLLAAKLRSIETRLPQVRGTNSGISALILPTGQIPDQTEYGVPQTLNVAVPIIQSPPTLVKSWGPWFGWVSLILGILGIPLIIRRAR